MSPLEILLIALGLAMDAFAVCIAAAASGRVPTRAAALRMAGTFGAFQAGMPIAGWFAGSRMANLVAAYDHWVAFGLLVLVGVRMLRQGAAPACREAPPDPSRGFTLIALGVATSIDALAVGLSLAMLQVSIWVPSLMIGLVTVAVSWVGVVLGCRLGCAFGRRMEIAGGCILILIGLRVLLAHMLA